MTSHATPTNLFKVIDNRVGRARVKAEHVSGSKGAELAELSGECIVETETGEALLR